MSLLILFFLLILVWSIPIALAIVFYIQKRRLQKKIDAIKAIIEEFDEAESKETEHPKRPCAYLRECKKDGSLVYQNLQK